MKLKILGAAALLLTSATIVQADSWTGYTYSSVSTTSAVKGMKKITEQVEQKTGGDLSIDLHLGKTLQISSSDITQAVGDGIVDFAADFFFSGNVPIGRVLSLPMLIENDEEWAKAYKAVEPILVKAFGKQGVILLGGYRYPEQTIFTTFKIDDLTDLEGHKIRVTSPEQGHFIKEFKGAAITLSGSEVPTSLERGVIEGVLTASAGGAKKWGEFLPYNYRFAVNYGNSVIIANKDSFEALSPDAQKALRETVAKVGPETTAAFLVDEEVQKKKQSNAGMTLIAAKAGDADMARKKMIPFWESWAKENGPEYEAALKLVRDAVNK
ncbi:MAG: TRAP transporter substrate-binding protein DctP [Methylocystaceae bacterium]|nr:TRAP transporter substrate-binding protein DctP [Methylocystaceae bacterium]